MNQRLLILDDELALLDSYKTILDSKPVTPRIMSSRSKAAVAIAQPQAQTAYQVDYFSKAEEALKAIEKARVENNPYAGGFFDVKLGPGIDGIEVIRRAKDIDPNLLCVVVTAYQDRSIDEITRIFGEEFADRWDYINKPFSQSEITQKARNLVSNWDRRYREKLYLEEIQKQQAQLIQSERLAAVGTIARGIGHEFGNILMHMMGLSELALRKKDVAQMEQTLKLIVSSAERAAVIVRNLQGLVRMETSREKTDVHVPLQESAALIQHELEKASIQVKFDLDPKLPKIFVNKVEIAQVFLNLMINAIHAMEEKGGTLTLKSYQTETHAIIEISDVGVGISDENMKRLFEPLFTTKGSRGTGIGLSVCRKIITNHKGTIQVESKLGQGSTFRITLPKS